MNKKFELYDNEGQTMDRYTLIHNGSIYTLSHNALSAQGVNMYYGPAKGINRKALGKKITWEDLPADVQKACKQKMEA